MLSNIYDPRELLFAMKKNFCEPVTTGNHYKSPGYYLTRRTSQSKIAFDDFENILWIPARNILLIIDL